MKNYYYVISIERNGKQLAYVKTVSGCYNLKHMIPADAVTVTAMETKKKAVETAAAWIKTWNQEGKLLFSENARYMPFELVNSNAYWE